MTTRTRIKRIFAGLGLILVVLIAGFLVVRPFYLNWGATREEQTRSMPGDLDGRGWTRAITVHAAPEAIWPWLVQWGQGRGGWYSYDWLENLFGFDIHTADRILPEYQTVALGEDICMAKGFCVSKVYIIEPHRYFGWQAAAEDGSPMWSFTLGLYPAGEGETRLIIRESFSQAAMPPIALFMLELPDVVMEQKALDTVRQRAEGRSASAAVTAVEITAWLAALFMGLAAGVRVVTQPAWQRPLAVGAAAVLVLLVLTALYPPLWLRVVLDAGLAAGLAWAFDWF